MAYLGSVGSAGTGILQPQRTPLRGVSPNASSPDVWRGEINKLMQQFGINPANLGAGNASLNLNRDFGAAKGYLDRGIGAIPDWMNVAANNVDVSKFVDPEAAIRAQLPGINEQAGLANAQTAARLAAGGTLASGAYAKAMGNNARRQSQDIAALTENLTYDASKFNSSQQLQAALANQQANLNASIANAQGLLATGQARGDLGVRGAGLMGDWSNAELGVNANQVNQLMDMYMGMRGQDYNNELQTYGMNLPYMADYAVNPIEQQRKLAEQAAQIQEAQNTRTLQGLGYTPDWSVPNATEDPYGWFFNYLGGA